MNSREAADGASEVRRGERLWWLIGMALAVPIIPFVLAGPWVEETIAGGIAALAGRPLATAAAVVAVLATDIFLPVPSSAVGTLAGQTIGPAMAVLCVWTGLMLAAAAGFEGAQRWGRPMAEVFCRPEELAAAASRFRRWGVAALALTRPVPILAEACILLAGLHQFPRRAFYSVIAAATAVLSVAFVGLGWISREGGWTSLGLLVSVLVPVSLAVLLRWKHR